MSKSYIDLIFLTIYKFDLYTAYRECTHRR